MDDDSRPSFNRAWFEARLKSVKKSQAALARHLGLPAATITKMFNGDRKLKIEEAEPMARFLMATPEDVLSNAGVNFGGTAKLDLQSIVTDKGLIVPAPEPMAVSAETMRLLRSNVPVDQTGNYEVTQVRAGKGGLSLLDDNLLLYETPTRLAPGPASVLSVSRLRDGTTVLGKVSSWRKTGEAVIQTPDGTEKKVELAASSPVLLIVP